MANERARSVKTKIKPMYYHVKMNGELKKVSFAFSKITLCSVLAGLLDNGINFRFTLKIANKKFLSNQMS